MQLPPVGSGAALMLGVITMASSRTGSAKWKRIRRIVINEARNAGITHCPGYEGHQCNRLLDYDTFREPDSVEVDHVVPYSAGGADSIENARILCYTCNRERGAGSTPAVPEIGEFPLDGVWLEMVVPANG